MILVTGGTGTLGSHLIPLLPTKVRVLSRHSHEPADGVEYVTGDLATGEGLGAALSGVDTVLHLAGGPKGDAEATENLVRAASGVRHLVYVSVIGADRVPLAWFKSKLGAEQAVMNSGIPWTILRAAQFHDLTLKAVRTMAKLPVIPIPGGLRFQPVDAREVAARLAELTLGEPAGLVPDLAGPRVYAMGELVRSYLEVRGKRRLKMPMRIPGRAGHAYRAGDNLTVDGATTGIRTWEDFLTERVPG
jgi:uncharacterized protein YbjT (DUF2867 family)